MSRNNQIKEELLEIAPGISAISQAHPFKVPEGYFDEFCLKMKLQVAPKTSYKVPDGYFDEFPNRMLASLKQLESESNQDDIGPLLESIQRKSPYSVPPGYFENIKIPEQVLAAEKAPAKVVRFDFMKRVRQISAAAAVLFTVGLAWTIFQINPPKQDDSIIPANVNVEAQLSNMDDSMLTDILFSTSESAEFATYLLAGTENLEQTIADLPTTDLNEYLKDHPILPPGS